jgi:hypothetical protein
MVHLSKHLAFLRSFFAKSRFTTSGGSISVCFALLLGTLEPSTLGQQAAPGSGQPEKWRWELMDNGPFFISNLKGPAPALKTVTLRLGDEQAAVNFDTMTLRWNAAWTGGFLNLPKGREGMEGVPTPRGQLLLTTPLGLGWSFDGSFVDPRPTRHEPLPSTLGKWHGLYVHRDRTVLSYSLGRIGVLESADIQTTDTAITLARVIQFDRNARNVSLLLAGNLEAGALSTDFRGNVGPMVVALKDGSTLTIGGVDVPESRLVQTADGLLVLHMDQVRANTPFRILFSSTPSPAGFHKAVWESTPDLRPFLEPGPGRWGDSLSVPGRLGTSGGEGPYVVDTLPVPEDNPFQSWIRLAGLDFFSDPTRAAVCSVSGDVWIVGGIDESLENVTWKRFATGLFQPLGLKIVHDVVYVTCRDGIYRLNDRNRDDEADFYECLNHEITITDNYHEFCLGLETDRAGNFYFNKGGNLGWANIPHQGTLLRVPPDGSRLDIVATGLRAPNGLGMGPNDEITTSDNEGNWVPASRVNLTQPGGFYGHVFTSHQTPPPTHDYDPPLFWLPKNQDNSSGGQVWVTSKKWGPFSGDMLHTSYGTSSLFKAFYERVDGVAQGGFIRFPLQFDSGIMRGRFNPRDGQLYLVGLVIWQSNGPRKGAFHRVRYTGKPVHSPRHLTVQPDGVQIQFTSPLDPESVADIENWSVERWNYLWTEKYGSPEVSALDPEVKGRDPVEVVSAKLLSDGHTVHLKLSVIEPVMQQRIRFSIDAADGTPVEHELYHTIHVVPGENP